MKPVIYWVRRDFRIGDNAALSAACASGRPVIALFICDEVVEGHGAAPKFRLGEGVRVFGAALAEAGSRLKVGPGAVVPAEAGSRPGGCGGPCVGGIAARFGTVGLGCSEELPASRPR